MSFDRSRRVSTRARTSCAVYGWLLLLGILAGQAFPADLHAGESLEFALTSLSGDDVVLSELRGKVVIVNFWATWCPPCRMEIPHLNTLYEEYEDEGLEIVGISLDRGGERVVRPFVEKNDMEYIIAMGNQEVVSTFGGITGIPTSFVIDRNGVLQHKWVGFRDEKSMRGLIQPLLKEETDN